MGKLYDLTTSYINPDRLPTLQDMLLLLWNAPENTDYSKPINKFLLQPSHDLTFSGIHSSQN